MESVRFEFFNRIIHLGVAECLFILLDKYHKIQAELSLDRNENKKLNLQKDAHMNDSKRCRGMLTDWLYREHHDDLYKCLQVKLTVSHFVLIFWFYMIAKLLNI